MVFRKAPFRFGFRSVKKRTSRWIPNEQPKTYNDAVYPKLPFLIRTKPYHIKNQFAKTPGTMLDALTINVTDLFRDERVLLGFSKATEMRPHVERLIVEAMRNGDRHRPTMALANYWLREKNLIHKLFKVLVPRYQDYATSFTALHLLGKNYALTKRPHQEVISDKGSYFHQRGEVVLELRGNSLPPIIRPKMDFKAGLLTNILMDGARESRRLELTSQARSSSSSSSEPPPLQQQQQGS